MTSSKARVVLGTAAVLAAATACSSGPASAPAPAGSTVVPAAGTSSAAVATTTTTTTTSTAPTTTAPTSTDPAARTDCGVDLGAPEVATAAASLGTEPITGRPFASTPVGGSFDPCATLSTALVTVAGGTGSSPTQALLFHDGGYVGTATARAYGLTEYDPAASSDDTVGLSYTLPSSCNACNDGIHTTVRYQWDGSRVVMLDPPPPTS